MGAMDALHVLGISGSLRKGSYNTALLRIAAGLAPEGMTVEIWDLAPIPLYNEDVRLAGEPEAVQQFKGAIAKADALLIAVTEYNYSVSGVLKNAIDWASRPPQTSPLNGKPVAMMGAGASLGTARAQYHMRQVAVCVKMLPLSYPELFVPQARDKFDAEGNLLDDTIRARIRALLEALASWTRQLRPHKGT
jgi:chromate reductase